MIAMSIEQFSVWDEVDEFLTSTPSPDQIIAFHPSEAMQARLHQLVGKSLNGTLNARERAELDQHLALENFMRRLKIKASAKIEPRQYPIFRFWEAPSFEPIISWTILVDRFVTGFQNPMVRRVIGSKLTAFTSRDTFKDMREDISLKNAKVDDYYLKPHEFEALNFYKNFSFQIMNTDRLSGLDGTIYGMQICHVLPNFIVEWWEDGSEGWREMTNLARQTMAFLSKRLDRLETEFKDINQLHPPDHKIWTRLDEA